MTENTNEMQKVEKNNQYGSNLVDSQTGEIIQAPNQQRKLVATYPDANVYQLANGEFLREQIYHAYQSTTPVTLQEKKILFSVLNEEKSKHSKYMKDMQGETITIDQCFIQPYEQFSTESGNESKVRCVIFDKNKKHYISTTSVGVYFSLKNIFSTFGYPNTEGYEPIQVLIGAKSFEKGDTNTITIV